MIDLEYVRPVPEVLGRWVLQGNEAYYLDLRTGRWGPSIYTARQIRGMVRSGILFSADPVPFTLSMVGA